MYAKRVKGNDELNKMHVKKVGMLSLCIAEPIFLHVMIHMYRMVVCIFTRCLLIIKNGCLI